MRQGAKKKMKPHIEYFFSKWAKVRKAKPEDAICVEIGANLRQLAIHDELNGLFFNVENEGSSGRSHQLNLLKKASGKIPGVSDYVFVRNGLTLFVEIKTSKGKQQKSQEHFEAWCNDHDLLYFICRSWADVNYLLTKHGFLVKN